MQTIQNPTFKTQRHSFTMDNLSLEIVQMIFSYVDDLDTLRAITSTCRYLHVAFASWEKPIVTQVLLNQLGWDVLPEAIAVDESSRLGPYDSQKAEEFSKRHLRHRMTSLDESTCWNLTEALQLARFYEVVEFLAEVIVESGWGSHVYNWIQEDQHDPGPSLADFYRVERALYRFQLYWNIFGSSSAEVDLDEQRDVFFRHFNVWENEQLRCAQHLLHRMILKPVEACKSFRSVDMRTWWGEDAQYLLSQGLEHIYRIATADSTDDVLELIWDSYSRRSPGRVRNTLADGLRTFRSPNVAGLLFNELSVNEIESLLENPHCDDNNCSLMLLRFPVLYDDMRYADINGILPGMYSYLDEGYAFWGHYLPDDGNDVEDTIEAQLRERERDE
ncbi:hypothetical protein F4805DRAFT_430763 [Annulohypoxylon moriforme]|nr:hypothetical protein F4805DRAFT_430763 [Annulohypoxylon moriforme]